MLIGVLACRKVSGSPSTPALRLSVQKLKLFHLRDLCALVREMSAPAFRALARETEISHGDTKSTEEARKDGEATCPRLLLRKRAKAPKIKGNASGASRAATPPLP